MSEEYINVVIKEEADMAPAPVVQQPSPEPEEVRFLFFAKKLRNT